MLKEILLEGNITANVKFFVSQWNNYSISSGLRYRTEEEKIAVLLSAVGEECFRMYENFPLTSEDKSTAENVLKAIVKYTVPNVNKRYERAMFNMTINKIKVAELSEKQLRELTENEEVNRVRQIPRSRSKERRNMKTKDRKRENSEFYDRKEKCNYCGYDKHNENEKCPAYGKQCNYCKKNNHFATVCLRNKNTKSNEEVNQMRHEENNEWQDEVIYSLGVGPSRENNCNAIKF